MQPLIRETGSYRNCVCASDFYLLGLVVLFQCGMESSAFATQHDTTAKIDIITTKSMIRSESMDGAHFSEGGMEPMSAEEQDRRQQLKSAFGYVHGIHQREKAKHPDKDVRHNIHSGGVAESAEIAILKGKEFGDIIDFFKEIWEEDERVGKKSERGSFSQKPIVFTDAERERIEALHPLFFDESITPETEEFDELAGYYIRWLKASKRLRE